MPTRITFDERYSASSSDDGIRALLCGSDEDEASSRKREKLRKILLKVIKNDLTPRQTRIIMLYYFEGHNIIEIGEMLGVTPQAVSAVMKRARLRIMNYLKYLI